MSEKTPEKKSKGKEKREKPSNLSFPASLETVDNEVRDLGKRLCDQAFLGLSDPAKLSSAVQLSSRIFSKLNDYFPSAIVFATKI